MKLHRAANAFRRAFHRPAAAVRFSKSHSIGCYDNGVRVDATLWRIVERLGEHASAECVLQFCVFSSFFFVCFVFSKFQWQDEETNSFQETRQTQDAQRSRKDLRKKTNLAIIPHEEHSAIICTTISQIGRRDRNVFSFLKITKFK